VTPPERYCPEHKAKSQARYAGSQRLYDQRERDPEVVAFYKSKAWEALRIRILERDAWLCQPCLRAKRITRADTVHHIVPVKEAWDRRLDPTNVESICRACHNRIHGRREAPQT